MSIAIDLAIASVALFCTWRGFKNGLIRGVCGILALVISIFAANVVATAYSGEFTGMLKPFVGGVVDNVITDIFTENEASDTWLKDGMYSLAFSALRKIGLPQDSAESLAGNVTHEEILSVSRLSEIISDKLSELLAYAAVFGICFVLLAIAFSVVGNLLNYVFSIPGIEQIDSLAGAVLGLGKALIIIFTVAAVARYIGLLAAPVVEDTVILKYVININPVARVLGI